MYNVYLTSKRFDSPARNLRNAIFNELKKRGVDGIKIGNSQDVLNMFRSHKTFKIAIAFDFYKDGMKGSGITLNEDCSSISRDFAYTLSSNYDVITPMISWRDIRFVDSYDKEWFRFFNNISANTKMIFHLCTYNNPSDKDEFHTSFEKIVSLFVEEIIRCLRSECDSDNYRKRVEIAKMKKNKR